MTDPEPETIRAAALLDRMENEGVSMSLATGAVVQEMLAASFLSLERETREKCAVRAVDVARESEGILTRSDAGRSVMMSIGCLFRQLAEEIRRGDK